MRSQPRQYPIGGAQSQGSCTAPRSQRLRWSAATTAWRLLCAAWYFMRQVSGDDAYERYREHMLRAHSGQPAMTRSEYYRLRTEQKWSRANRCC
jgi:uncharacterized short protein YbdD (DUF466 family)